VHEKGLIHRDLKPANIFLVKKDVSDFDSVVIGDFGLATWTNQLASNTSDEQVGTFVYMSPEQKEKKPFTQKTDIYAMGVIFFELYNLFGTQMERARALTKLHEGQLPQEFRTKYLEESQLILWMCSHSAESRPTCNQLLRQSFFRSQNLSPNDFKVLKQQIQKLEQTNEDKQRIIENQNKRIQQLEEQLARFNSQKS